MQVGAMNYISQIEVLHNILIESVSNITDTWWEKGVGNWCKQKNWTLPVIISDLASFSTFALNISTDFWCERERVSKWCKCEESNIVKYVSPRMESWNHFLTCSTFLHIYRQVMRKRRGPQAMSRWAMNIVQLCISQIMKSCFISQSTWHVDNYSGIWR